MPEAAMPFNSKEDVKMRLGNAYLISAFVHRMAILFLFICLAYPSAYAGKICYDVFDPSRVHSDAKARPAKSILTSEQLWAQYRIGLELVKADAELGLAIASGKTVSAAVLDGPAKSYDVLGRFSKNGRQQVLPSDQSQTSNHIHLVSHQFFDSEVGSALNASLDLVIPGAYTVDNRLSQLRDFAQSNVRLGNASLSFERLPSKDFEAALDSIQGKILVLSSGNYYPAPSTQAALFLNRSQFINVGNLNRDGTIDPTSAQGSHVTVLAPAGDSILSKDSDGQFAKFGGTSAAAPLAAGVIANVISILPEINSDELALLIRKTSIPTLIQSLGSRQNGSGLINSYLLLKVAARIKSALVHSPSNLASILQDPQIFDFSSLASRHEVQYKRLGRLDDLRKAFYLQPNKRLAHALAIAYQKNGDEESSAFFLSLALDPAKDLKQTYRFLMSTKSKGDCYYSEQWPVTGRDGVIMMNRLDTKDHLLVKMFVKDIENKIRNSASPSELVEIAKLLSFLDYDIPEAEEAFAAILDRSPSTTIGTVLQAVFQAAPSEQQDFRVERQKRLMKRFMSKIKESMADGNQIAPYITKMLD